MGIGIVSAVVAVVVIAALALGLPILTGSGGPGAPTVGSLESPAAQAAAVSAAPVASAAAPVADVAAARANAVAAAPAQQTEIIATIVVSGEGVVSVKPDIAHLSMGVTIENRSLAVAQSEASAKMNAVIDSLTALGIARDDIQTVNFSVSPVYDYPGDGRAPVLRGFQVSNQVSVKIRDITKVGEVADAVVSVGATTVNGLSFGVDNPQGAQDQARSQALADAKRKAEQLANGAGVGLGRPISISESTYGGPQPVTYRGDVAEAAAAAPPPIEAGTAEIRSIVNITYLIQ